MAARKEDRDLAATTAEQAGEMGRRGAEQMRQILGAGNRVYEDVSDLSHDDMEALVESGSRLAKGMQDMGMEVMSYTQQSLQLGLQTANQLMTCRTIDDMLNVQRNFMRQSMDTFLHESARILEMSSDVASKAVDPLNEITQNTARH